MTTIRLLYTLKDMKKREQLAGILDSDDSTIETLDADYEDIDSLHNLDVTIQCGKHVKNCAL